MYTDVSSDTPQNVNVGIAGSLTMVFLCLGVAFLCLSFYRRYKRGQVKEFDLGDQIGRDATHPIPREGARPTDNE